MLSVMREGKGREGEPVTINSDDCIYVAKETMKTFWDYWETKSQKPRAMLQEQLLGALWNAGGP